MYNNFFSGLQIKALTGTLFDEGMAAPEISTLRTRYESLAAVSNWRDVFGSLATVPQYDTLQTFNGLVNAQWTSGSNWASGITVRYLRNVYATTGTLTQPLTPYANFNEEFTAGWWSPLPVDPYRIFSVDPGQLWYTKQLLAVNSGAYTEPKDYKFSDDLTTITFSNPPLIADTINIQLRLRDVFYTAGDEFPYMFGCIPTVFTDNLGKGNLIDITYPRTVSLFPQTVVSFDGSDNAIVVPTPFNCLNIPHGLETGKSVKYTVSAGNVAIGGMSAGTLYFAVAIDSSTLQLSLTREDALLDNPKVIEITGTGIGNSHQISLSTYGIRKFSSLLSQAVGYATANNLIMPSAATATFSQFGDANYLVTGGLSAMGGVNQAEFNAVGQAFSQTGSLVDMGAPNAAFSNNQVLSLLQSKNAEYVGNSHLKLFDQVLSDTQGTNIILNTNTIDALRTPLQNVFAVTDSMIGVTTLTNSSLNKLLPNSGDKSLKDINNNINNLLTPEVNFQTLGDQLVPFDGGKV